MANIEIERKFLVLEAPQDLPTRSFEQIFQGYAAVVADGTEVRVRQKGSKYFLTIKSGGDKIRKEYEVDLTKDQFATIWSATEGKRVEKNRYRIMGPNHEVFELDVYHGKLSGLMTVEVEFESEEASDAFVPPKWFGLEVTNDPRYKNQSLALHGLPA